MPGTARPLIQPGHLRVEGYERAKWHLAVRHEGKTCEGKGVSGKSTRGKSAKGKA